MIKLIFTLLISGTLAFAQKNTDLNKIEKGLKINIEKSQNQQNNVLQELHKIDESLETKLDSLIDRLAKVKDSRETGSKIIRNKKKIIRDLQKAQKDYNSIRDHIDRDFKNNHKYIRKDLQHLLSFMDVKIDERIKQITKITESLNAYKEYYDWGNRRNDRQNVRTADKEKDRVIKEFEKEITTLQKKAENIDKEFNNAGSKERVINTYSEMQVITERINLIEHSVEDILNGNGANQKVGRYAELRIDKEIRKSTASIQGFNKTLTYTLQAYQRLLKQRQDLEKKLDIINQNK
ncbi:MAG: hypothetical protein NE334_03035 [Lentisphaeraceae bacterium]|nr:hypothetical protein [Lentisphaeraceae bacterium]